MMKFSVIMLTGHFFFNVNNIHCETSQLNTYFSNFVPLLNFFPPLLLLSSSLYCTPLCRAALITGVVLQYRYITSIDATSRAVQLIACDSQAHLVSEAGSDWH